LAQNLTNKRKERKCISGANVIHIQHNSWFQLMQTLRLCLFANFFKAGCGHMGFPGFVRVSTIFVLIARTQYLAQT